MSGGPKICKLAHAFLWEYSYRRLELAQLLDQLSVCLTWAFGSVLCSLVSTSAHSPLDRGTSTSVHSSGCLRGPTFCGVQCGGSSVVLSVMTRRTARENWVLRFVCFMASLSTGNE